MVTGPGIPVVIGIGWAVVVQSHYPNRNKKSPGQRTNTLLPGDQIFILFL